MPTSQISTPLKGVDAAIVIAALHNHDLMIKDCLPSAPTYTITDKKPIGQTTYTLTLTNVPDGVDSLVNAKPPVGILTISGKWRVTDGTLNESIDIDANFMMKKVAKSTVEKTHPEQHLKLLEAARG
ncbi:conserved hypothetical protein [Pyrenophora tritici-repentis Pt-1C-BFP]|uniref:Uncharacterized protein n=1 Tax=Pyrenophora tritici-repentis (strain Pt-1C-BFP) TaxID=426418 RepID=B2WKA1_PYRTR|nr:uncharacterized protein PTRG_10290 [Pyrenophora tritici-repentis Pt-1C-BFP]EDU43341.1 conserved hypothetical protein [Pyrenophora tritici-repentis Pt-1C-BFP]